MVQHLHKLTPLLSFTLVRYSGDLIVHLLQDLRSSRALIFPKISVGTSSVLSQCRLEGRWCDDDTQDLFSFSGSWLEGFF